MMFGYVRRERLSESERFWKELLDKSTVLTNRVLAQQTELVDKYIEVVRENERLRAKFPSKPPQKGEEW